MDEKLIIGCSPWLETALATWKMVEPSVRLIPVEISVGKEYKFCLDNLSSADAHRQTAFVAWGPDYLNFQRLELFGTLKAHGFKLPPLIHPSAQVSSDAVIHENTWVGALVSIGPGTTLGMNSVVCIGSRLDYKCRIGRSVWIGKDVSVGSLCKVESNVVIGDRVEIAPAVTIGRQSRLEIATFIGHDIPERSFELSFPRLSGRVVDQ